MSQSSEEEIEYNSSSSSDQEEDAEQQYSLRVRLLSAVDLPPSLSPTVPLCPWFMFGLVEDVNGVSLADDGGGRQTTRGGDDNGGIEEEEERRQKRLHPKWEGVDDNDDDEDARESKEGTGGAASVSIGGDGDASHLLQHLAAAFVRTSTSKIMSKVSTLGVIFQLLIRSSLSDTC